MGGEWSVVAVVIGGLAGVLVGALIDAVATRLPADLSTFGPAACAACGAELPARPLDPRRGPACPACGARQPWHKLATEVAAAAVVALALLLQGVSYAGVTTALFSLLLLLILRIDWQHHLIYTVTIGPGLALALGAAALHSSGALLSAALAALGAAAVFGLFFALAVVIYRQQALGFGDILLAGLIGAMTGRELVVPAIFYGMALAALGGVFLIAIRRRGRRDYIPYGAYLCLGTILVLLTR